MLYRIMIPDRDDTVPGEGCGVIMKGISLVPYVCSGSTDGEDVPGAFAAARGTGLANVATVGEG